MVVHRAPCRQRSWHTRNHLSHLVSSDFNSPCTCDTLIIAGVGSREGSHSWSSAVDLKSTVPQGTASSNLAPSAKIILWYRYVGFGVVYRNRLHLPMSKERRCVYAAAGWTSLPISNIRHIAFPVEHCSGNGYRILAPTTQEQETAGERSRCNPLGLHRDLLLESSFRCYCTMGDNGK